ncbi:hypothetical protein JCM11641_005303 [Rhodosporidiobolus odoratus]
MVLRDIEAGLPLLDKLGILLRPVRGEDGKIDLLVWEAALQMPTDSNWARALFKPKVFFGRDQQQLAYENLEDPAQLEPYQMAKYATLSFQIAAVTASLRHGFSQEVFGCPCSSVIRKEPDEYSNRVRRIVPTMLPAPNDVEDLVEALQRAEYRKKTR